MPRETAQTLDRGLTVLELVLDRSTGVRVNELATELGVGRTVVYRLVATLEDHHLVRRDGSGRVLPGSAVLGLGHAGRSWLRDSAQPLLDGLASEVGAACHLSFVEGDDTVTVAVASPPGAAGPVVEGTTQPLPRVAAGLAVLRARQGATTVVSTSGEPPTGAFAVAAPLVNLPVEGSVGVVSAHPLDAATVGAAVLRTATQMRSRLAG